MKNRIAFDWSELKIHLIFDSTKFLSKDRSSFSEHVDGVSEKKLPDWFLLQTQFHDLLMSSSDTKQTKVASCS